MRDIEEYQNALTATTGSLRETSLKDRSRALLGRELLVEHRRVDRARAKHVGPDLPILEFASLRPRERPERCLGGSVCGLAGHSLDVGDRGREDDGASPTDHRRELLDREKRSFGVQVEHLVVDRLGHALERRWNAEPGVDEEQHTESGH